MTPVTLFCLGSFTIVAIGILAPVMLELVSYAQPLDSPALVCAAFQYLLLGAAMFSLGAAVYQRRRQSGDSLAGGTIGKVSFWLMFAGFNLAFFPVSNADATALLTDPVATIRRTLGPTQTFGLGALAAGGFLIMWHAAFDHTRDRC